jgi:hypothetical protein
MEMLGKELPLYRIDREPHPCEHIAYYDINENQCHLSVIREDTEHLLVATVNGVRVAVSGTQLLGVALKLMRDNKEKSDVCETL